MAGKKRGEPKAKPHAHRHSHGVRRSQTHGAKSMEALSRISQKKQDEEIKRSLEFGLEAANSIIDRNISLFSRGHQPAFAGINTFMKAPYCEDIREIGALRGRLCRRAVQLGHHLSPGHAFRPAGRAAHLGAL